MYWLIMSISQTTLENVHYFKLSNSTHVYLSRDWASTYITYLRDIYDLSLLNTHIRFVHSTLSTHILAAGCFLN